MKKIIRTVLLALVSVCQASSVIAQNIFRATVLDNEMRQPIIGAIVADRHGHGGTTDDSGKVNITVNDLRSTVFYVNYTGYKLDSIITTFPDDTRHIIYLTADRRELEEVVFVASTRTNERIENAPIKIEVLGSEELGEENSIKPGNIASILGDVSGIQIQQSSAVSGNTNVRIQGLNGQYTQILRDGMPLYDGFSGGFGILQVAPLDLKQAELIKGAASTLYGGGAIAGLINLVSKKPSEGRDGIFTMNASSLGEQNLNAYLSKRNKQVGYTLFTGYTHQQATDVNNDGLSDVAEMNSLTIHPRLFLYPDEKTIVTAGYSGTFENRIGGDMQVINKLPDSIHRFYERNITARNTAELSLERTLKGYARLTVKGSSSFFDRDITSNTISLKGHQLNYYTEASVFIPQKKNNIVTGLNVTGDQFKTLPGRDTIPLPDLAHSTAGVFAQYTIHFTEKTTLEAGLRGDHTFQNGDFILPRLAFFHRFSDMWALRAGTGFGYKVPNPLEQQTIDYPLQNLLPPSGLNAERSVGYNIEGNFRKDLNQHTELFINHAFFLTTITSPIVATELANKDVVFSNAGSPVNTMGFDTYVKLAIRELELYAGYTYTDVERNYMPGNSFMPLTPANRFAFTAVEKFSEHWRIGLEGSYIGTQYRDGDTKTPPYFLTALMIERKVGKLLTIVLNGENLLDYRQTKVEQVYTGTISAPQFKPLWAPLDGRVINLSVRITPFNK